MKEVYVVRYGTNCNVFSSKESAYRITASGIRRGFRYDQTEELSKLYQREDYEGYISAWNKYVTGSPINQLVCIDYHKVDCDLTFDEDSFKWDDKLM